MVKLLQMKKIVLKRPRNISNNIALLVNDSLLEASIKSNNEFINSINELVIEFLKTISKYSNVELLYLKSNYQTIHMLKNTNVLLYMVDGYIIGYLSYNFREYNNSVYINEIYVREKYRCSGIGKQLLDYTASIVYDNDKYENLSLSVHENNEIAKQFYLKYGFKFC